MVGLSPVAFVRMFCFGLCFLFFRLFFIGIVLARRKRKEGDKEAETKSDCCTFFGSGLDDNFNKLFIISGRRKLYCKKERTIKQNVCLFYFRSIWSNQVKYEIKLKIFVRQAERCGKRMTQIFSLIFFSSSIGLPCMKINHWAVDSFNNFVISVMGINLINVKFMGICYVDEMQFLMLKICYNVLSIE